MESQNFKTILTKFKEGANSMEAVYNELAYLTSNYDKTIEKVQKEVDEEKARANNEEFLRHEAEKNLEDLRKLQEADFSRFIDDLLKNPKEEFKKELKWSIKKMALVSIVMTILAIVAITFYSQTLKPQTTNNKALEQKINSVNTKLNQLQKENSELKELLKNILSQKQTFIQQEEKKESAKSDDEVIVVNPVNKEDEKLDEMEKESMEVPIEKKEQTQDELLSSVLANITAYDKKYKLNSKNSTRILYKMFLLDLSPFKHELIIEELNLYAKKGTYIPKKEDLLIWDKQMLLIYTKMLENIKDIPESKITSDMRSFSKYKYDDATNYSGWEYVGEDGLSMKESIQKEIDKLTSQIIINKN